MSDLLLAPLPVVGPRLALERALSELVSLQTAMTEEISHPDYQGLDTLVSGVRSQIEGLKLAELILGRHLLLYGC